MSGTQVAGTLTLAEIQTAQFLANLISTNVSSVVSPNTFVYWAGFDGTRNNAGDPALAGDIQSTAIRALRNQITSQQVTCAGGAGSSMRSCLSGAFVGAANDEWWRMMAW